MKKITNIIGIILAALALAWAVYIVAQDAKHRTGFFMTTATYREHVAEGKR